jgi:hypothetical protein
MRQDAPKRRRRCLSLLVDASRCDMKKAVKSMLKKDNSGVLPAKTNILSDK